MALETSPVMRFVPATRGNTTPDDPFIFLVPRQTMVAASGEALFFRPVHGSGQEDFVIGGKLAATEEGECLFRARNG